MDPILSQEPPADELEDLDEIAASILLECEDEIAMNEDARKKPSETEFTPFFDELANIAWFTMAEECRMHGKMKNSFRAVVEFVTPHVSDRHHDAKEILRMMRHEIGSRLSAII